MRIAIPLARGVCCENLESCERMAFVDVDERTRSIVGSSDIAVPLHGEEVPFLVARLGAGLIVAGGMDPRMRQTFRQLGIVVLLGAPPWEPRHLVQALLFGSSSFSGNA